jgi:hypothetical protein
VKGQSDKSARAQKPRDAAQGMPKELRSESDSVDQLVSDLLNRIDAVAPAPGMLQGRRSTDLDAFVAEFLAPDSSGLPTSNTVPVPELLQSTYVPDKADIDAEVARTLKELDHARTPSPAAPSPAQPTAVTAAPPDALEAHSTSTTVAPPDVVLEAPPSLVDLELVPTVLEAEPPPTIVPSPEVVLESPPPLVDVELPPTAPEAQPPGAVTPSPPAALETALPADVELPREALEAQPPPAVDAALPPSVLESPAPPAIVVSPLTVTESPPPTADVASAPAVMETMAPAEAGPPPTVPEAPPPVTEITSAEKPEAEAVRVAAPYKEEPPLPASEYAPEPPGDQKPAVADGAPQPQLSTVQAPQIPKLLIVILVMVAIALIVLGIRFCAGHGPGSTDPTGVHVSLQTHAT